MSRRWRGKLFLQSLDYHHRRLFLLIFLTEVALLSSWSGDDSNSFYWQSSSALLGARAVNAFEQDLAFATRRTSSSSSYLNRPYQLWSLKKDDYDSSPELSSSTTASRSLHTTKQLQRRKRRRQPELWLDLRDMAIHPKAAIDYIEDRLVVGGDNNNDNNSGTSSVFLPDRILLSQIVFQNLIDHSDLYLTCEPEILYQKNADNRSNHNNNGDDVDVSDDDDGDSGGGDSDSRSDESMMGRIDIFSSNGEGLSFPFGRIVPFGKDVSVAVSDPWSAMDVLTKGRWLVLGDGDGDGGNSDIISTTSSSTRTISEDDEFLRMGSVGDFIAIASSSAVTVGNSLTTTSDSGLILPTTAGTAETKVSKNLQHSDDDETTTETSSYDVGGIAVPCRHKSSLMAFASMHQSTMTTSSTPLTLAAASTSTTTTTMSDSGILIQSTVSEQDDSNYDSGQTNTSAELPTAIILPFDVDLWEMAFMLYG